MISFIIEGTPRPQGSKRHVGKGIMVESSKYVADWRAFAKLKASIAMRGFSQIEKPAAVAVIVTFYFDRPRKHLRSSGTLKPDAPVYHTARPDGEKLMRALLDSLTGVCFHDDSQVAVQRIEKRYATEARSDVQVMSVEDFRRGE